MGFEDDYLDVLQNIEFAIIQIYRSNGNLTDNHVISVLEAIIDSYVAEKIGRAPRLKPSSEIEKELFANVKSACNFRLGIQNGESKDKTKSDEKAPGIITPDELLACLKRVLKSAHKWNKEGGQRGYLDFVKEFVK